METLSGKIAAALLALFMIAYVGYQGYRGFSDPIKTEAALLYTVQDIKRVKGLVVRNEAVVAQPVSGVVAYYNDDGVKVTYGTPIAEVYATKEDVTNKRRIKALEAELNQLEEIQKPGNNYFLNSDVITKQINENLYTIIDKNEAQSLADIADEKANLLTNLNKKQLATGAATDFQNKVDELQAEKSRLESSISATSEVITSTEVGYFSSYVDGLEQFLSPKTLEDLTLDQLHDYIDQKHAPSETGIGKIIQQELWYFVLPLPKEEAMLLYEGMTLNINFGLSGYRKVPAVISSIRSSEEDDEDMVILSCDYMGSQLTRLRNPSAQLNFQRYTGVKIPNQAVRFKNNVRGVYVKVGDEIVFKTVDVIYEGAGYILSSTNTGEVKQYDEIVVKGNVTEAAAMSSAASSAESSDAPSDAASSGNSSSAVSSSSDLVVGSASDDSEEQDGDTSASST